MPPLSKRSRTEQPRTKPPRTKPLRTSGTSAPPPKSPIPYEDLPLETLLDKLDVHYVRALVIEASRLDADVAQRVRKSAIDGIKMMDNWRTPLSERAKSFDHLTGMADYQLNQRYTQAWSGGDKPPLDEMTRNVSHKIGVVLDGIGRRTQPNSSFGTKRNALEATRAIFKNVYLSAGEIPEQVRQQAQTNASNWGDKILVVLSRFTPSQLHTLALSEDGAILGGFRELERLAHEHSLFENEVAEVVTTLGAALRNDS